MQKRQTVIPRVTFDQSGPYVGMESVDEAVCLLFDPVEDPSAVGG